MSVEMISADYTNLWILVGSIFFVCLVAIPLIGRFIFKKKLGEDYFMGASFISFLAVVLVAIGFIPINQKSAVLKGIALIEESYEVEVAGNSKSLDESLEEGTNDIFITFPNESQPYNGTILVEGTTARLMILEDGALIPVEKFEK